MTRSLGDRAHHLDDVVGDAGGRRRVGGGRRVRGRRDGRRLGLADDARAVDTVAYFFGYQKSDDVAAAAEALSTLARERAAASPRARRYCRRRGRLIGR